MKVKTIISILYILCFSLNSAQEMTISVRELGVDGIEHKNEDQKDKYNRWLQIKYAFEKAVKEKRNLFFPKGVYDVGSRNFPFRSSEDQKGNELLDCRGITIYGEKGTVLKTTSQYGADVLQLNKVKNLTVRDIEITAELQNYTRAGSNGISITNGFDKIVLENIKIYNLPGVAKAGYIDGGKGLTLQFAKGSKSYKGSLVAKQISVENCAYGFRMDAADLADVMDFSRTIDISLQMNISNAYQGFSIEYGAAGKNLLRDDRINIRADVSLDNCQQYVRFARVLGGDFNISVKKTSRSQSRTWTRWDKRSFAILGNYVKNAKVSVVGDVGKIDEKILLGAVGSIIEPFNLKNATENSKFVFDIRGISSKNDFTLIEYMGDSIHNSEIAISDRSLDKNKNLKTKLPVSRNNITVKRL